MNCYGRINSDVSGEIRGKTLGTVFKYESQVKNTFHHQQIGLALNFLNRKRLGSHRYRL